MNGRKLFELNLLREQMLLVAKSVTSDKDFDSTKSFEEACHSKYFDSILLHIVNIWGLHVSSHVDEAWKCSLDELVLVMFNSGRRATDGEYEGYFNKNDYFECHGCSEIHPFELVHKNVEGEDFCGSCGDEILKDIKEFKEGQECDG